jgi:hypothetical protein
LGKLATNDLLQIASQLFQTSAKWFTEMKSSTTAFSGKYATEEAAFTELAFNFQLGIMSSDDVFYNG